jgi:hypothetical protein
MLYNLKGLASFNDSLCTLDSPEFKYIYEVRGEAIHEVTLDS